MRYSCAALGVLLALGPGCAHDVRAKLPKTDPSLAGRIEIVFTREADDVAVVVDRELVVRGAHTERVIIDDVPAGFVDVMVAAGSGQGRVERIVRVEVDAGETTTIPLAAPDRSMVSDLPSTLMMLVVGFAVRAAYLAWF